MGMFFEEVNEVECECGIDTKESARALPVGVNDFVLFTEADVDLALEALVMEESFLFCSFLGLSSFTDFLLFSLIITINGRYCSIFLKTEASIKSVLLKF